MKKLIILASILLMATSCGPSIVKSYTTRSAYMPLAFESVPMVSELAVSRTKVSAEVKVQYKGQSRKSLEEFAVGEALNKANADILLEPRYEYVTKGKQLLSIKVSGYPARFSNFHKVTEEEAEIMVKLNTPPPTEALVIIKEKPVEQE